MNARRVKEHSKQIEYECLEEMNKIWLINFFIQNSYFKSSNNYSTIWTFEIEDPSLEIIS
jgi:hypothetical protein